MRYAILILLLCAVPGMGQVGFVHWVVADSVNAEVMPETLPPDTLPYDYSQSRMVKLEARIDSLEAMLKRAHVVAVDLLVPAWTTATESGLRAQYFRVVTRYGISFEEER